MNTESYVEFPKIARYSRECVITEKIDGTNGLIEIGESGEFRTGSRTKWITPEDDNYGFSRWAHDNKEELMKLGLGRHFGEWWGQGIQRKYGLAEKRFSLFNTSRWLDMHADNFRQFDASIKKGKMELAPSCCYVVPVIAYGIFGTDEVSPDWILPMLERDGSRAAPGFMRPEGIIIYHVQGSCYFKKTVDKDDEWKGKSA